MPLPRRFRAARLLLPLILIGAGGCQNPVRLVSRDAQCGVVAIPNNSDTWPTSYRSRALHLIEKECPDGYKIIGEGEVVLKDGGSGKGYEYEYNGALEKVETKKTEYRIRFCALTRNEGPPSPDHAPQPHEPPPAPGPPAEAGDLPPPRLLK
jgi:hypothetical protein